MVFRDIDKKALIDNAATVVSKITIVGTDIVFTENDYISEWEYEDFRYVPENGFIGQFVERLFDGKLKDLPTDINIENKEINLQVGIVNGITGETTYYDYGNFIVTKPGEEDTTGITSFESADYAKKFNATYTDNINYPCLALELANNACNQANVPLDVKGDAYCFAVKNEGLVAGGYSFLINGIYYNFSTTKDLKLYDSLLFILDENRIIQKNVNDDFTLTRIDIKPTSSSSMSGTLLKGSLVGYNDFINNDFVIENNQFEETDTLRDVMKAIAKLGYTWVRVGTDNKVHLDFKKKTTSTYGLTIEGKSVQDGTPTPDAPIEIESVEGVTNLFDGFLEEGTYNDAGNKVGSSANYRNVNQISVKPNETYTFSIDGVSQKYAVYYYDKNKSFISSTGLTTGTFTTPTNCYYINFRCFNADFIIDYARLKIQLEKGAIAHKYFPYGRWLEQKTTGKNNFNKDDVVSGYFNSSGSIVASGSWYYQYIKVKPNKDYVISGVTTANSTPQVVEYDKNMNFIQRIMSYRNGVFTTTEDTAYIGVSVINTDLGNYQFEENDTTTSYEAYKENIALIDMNKKNLKDNATKLTCSVDTTNKVVVANNNLRSLYVKVNPNTPYTIYKTTENTFRVTTSTEEPIVGASIISSIANHGADTITLTTEENANYLLITYYNSGNYALTEQEILDSIKIYEGLETDDYYRFASIGDTKDTFENGILTQRIGKVVLDGSESDAWSVNKMTYGYAFDIANTSGAKGDNSKKTLLSNKFKSSTFNDRNNGDVNIIYGYGGDSRIRILTDVATNVDEWKTWLSANPIEVEYNLKTPIEHTLDYEKLSLFDGANNISFNDDIIDNSDYVLVEDNITIDDYYETEKQPNIYGPVNKVLLGMSQIDGENVYNAKLVDEVENIEIEGKSVQDGTPTPDAPVEIESVEGITNLLNTPYTEDNKLTLTATKTDHYVITDYYAELEAGKTYTFSCKTSGTYGYSGQTECYLLLDKAYTTIKHMDNKDNFTFTPTVSGKYYLRYDVNVSGETHSFWNFQIEEGTKAHSYVSYGRWLEQKTIGKNMVDVSNARRGTYNGVTITYENNTLILNGTTTSYFDLYLVESKRNGHLIHQINNDLGSYTLSNNLGLENYMLTTSGYKQNIANITNEDKFGTAFVRIPSGKTYNNAVLKIQLEKGTKATEYEPYKENTALIDMNKKNLANINDIQVGKQWNDMVNTTRASIIFIPVKPNTQYTLSGDISSNSNLTTLRFVETNANKDTAIVVHNIGTHTTSSSTAYISIEILSSTTITNEMLKDVLVKLYEGVETDDYYRLASIGDVKDTFKDGILSPKIAKITLNGTESYEYSPINGFNRFILSADIVVGRANSTVLSTHFVGGRTDSKYNEIYLGGSGRIAILYNATSADEFKAWLSENPVDVYYIISTPKQKSYNINYEKLKLHKGYNKITLNDDLEPNMNIIVSDIDDKLTTYSGNPILANLSDNRETSIQIWDNPLTYTENLRKIALNGSESLFGVRYTPMNTNTVGHPWLEGDDYVKLTNLSEQTVYTYPFDRKLSYRGYIKSDISSTALTSVQQEYEFNGDVDNKLSKTEISVDKANKKITALASEVTDNTSKIASLTITTDNIKTEVSKKVSTSELNTAINNIEVGGRNLLALSDILYEKTNTSYSGTDGVNVVDSFDLNTLIGKKVAFSFFINVTGDRKQNTSYGNDMRNRFGMHATLTWAKADGTTTPQYIFAEHLYDTEVIDDRVVMTTTINPPSSAYVSLTKFSIAIQMIALPADTNTATWKLGYPKLEIGNKATDWSPAPEDYSTTTEMNSAIEQSASAIEMSVSNLSTDLDNATTEIKESLANYATENEVVQLRQEVTTNQTSTSLQINVIEEVLADGVSKVKTAEKGFTLDDNGLTIDDGDSNIASNLDNEGLQIYDKTGSTESELLYAGIDANTNEAVVRTKNLSVSQYFVMGSNSRFEDFEDEDGEEGTGVFFIG